MVYIRRIAPTPLLLLAFCGCDVILGVDEERSKICEPGTLRCSENAPERCGDDVDWEDPLPKCSGAEPVCSEGECVSVLQVDAGGLHTCAVLADHTVACWGSNRTGQLGDGTFEDRSSAVRVAGLTGVKKVVVNGSDATARSCALLEDETVKCWGGVNALDLFGDGSDWNRLEPTTVVGLSEVVDLALGSGHSCALIRGGLVKCWGTNNLGQVGQGVASPTAYPPMPVAGLGPVRGSADGRTLSAGGAHTCAITIDGRVTCWGSNGLGQCGVDVEVWSWGTSVPPTQAVPDLDEVDSVATGYFHTCAVGRYQGKKQTYCWGSNNCGQLGGMDNHGCDMTRCAGLPTEVKDECRTSTPTAVWLDADEVERSRAHSPSLGGHHTCIISGEGRVKCWGRNNSQQSNPSNHANVLAEDAGIPDYNSLGKIDLLTVGSDHACVRRVTGDVVCWGRNDFFQSGAGTSRPPSVPGPVHWDL